MSRHEVSAENVLEVRGGPGTSDRVFSRVRPRRRAEDIVAQVLEAIDRGSLAPGQKLPGERSLIEQFEVSRGCVREALRILEAMGVIRVVPGRGAFISEDPETARADALWLPWLRVHGTEVMDLLVVRQALESKAAFLATRRRDPACVAELERIVAEMERLLDPESGEVLDVAGAEELDIAFHTAVAWGSGNSYLRKLTRSVCDAIAGERRASYAIPGWAQMAIGHHRAILEALKDGDSQKAAALSEEHVGMAAEVIGRYLGGTGQTRPE